MQPWLKAGLVGSAVLVVLNLLGLIGCLLPITCILGLLAYAGIGALTAYWLPPLRDAGTGAGQGALAAVLAALIAGILNTIVVTMRALTADATEVLSLMPAESLQAFEQLGLDPAMAVGPQAGAFTGSLCCIVGLLLAAALGAIGGAILAGVKPD